MLYCRRRKQPPLPCQTPYTVSLEVHTLLPTVPTTPTTTYEYPPYLQTKHPMDLGPLHRGRGALMSANLTRRNDSRMHISPCFHCCVSCVVRAHNLTWHFTGCLADFTSVFVTLPKLRSTWTGEIRPSS